MIKIKKGLLEKVASDKTPSQLTETKLHDIITNLVWNSEPTGDSNLDELIPITPEVLKMTDDDIRLYYESYYKDFNSQPYFINTGRGALWTGKSGLIEFAISYAIQLKPITPQSYNHPL